jgi:hypothetical protein
MRAGAQRRLQLDYLAALGALAAENRNPTLVRVAHLDAGRRAIRWHKIMEQLGAKPLD